VQTELQGNIGILEGGTCKGCGRPFVVSVANAQLEVAPTPLDALPRIQTPSFVGIIPFFFDIAAGVLLMGLFGWLFGLAINALIGVVHWAGTTVTSGEEVARLGSTSIVWTRPDNWIPLGLAILFALIGGIVTAGISYEHRYCNALFAGLSKCSDSDRSLRLVSCLLIPKQFLQSWAVAKLDQMGPAGLAAVPFLELLTNPELKPTGSMRRSPECSAVLQQRIQSVLKKLKSGDGNRTSTNNAQAAQE
jgi:hypothetical protein